MRAAVVIVCLIVAAVMAYCGLYWMRHGRVGDYGLIGLGSALFFLGTAMRSV